MSEMVERVAKAAYESLFMGSWPDDIGTSIDAEGFRKAARAAIEAMREPTEEMTNSAERLDDQGSSIFGEPFVPCPHDEAWRVMIDAALNKIDT